MLAVAESNIDQEIEQLKQRFSAWAAVHSSKEFATQLQAKKEELDKAVVIGDRQFGVLGSEFPCAAVDALVVASVGDRDAQVMDDAAVAIGQP